MNTAAPMLLIKASAGTGKTYQLSSRYIELLLSGESPDKILATTFTRKAAGEILERIFLRLIEHILSADKSSKDNQKYERSFESLLANQHRLSIQTLDSFFVNLAKSFPLELNIPVELKISDADEQNELWTKVCEELIKSYEFSVIASIIRAISNDQIKRSVLTIPQELAQLYELSTQATPDKWKEVSGGQSLDEGALRSALNAFGNFQCPSTKTGGPNKNWLKAIEKVKEYVDRKDFKSLLRSGLTQKVFSGEMQYYKIDLTEDQVKILSPLVEHARAFVLKEISTRTKTAGALLKTLSDIRADLLKKGIGWSFGDISRAVATILSSDSLSSVFYRLDSSYSHILLDEFQDTSISQFEILEPVIDEIASKADGKTHSFFCVGDRKQAIYRWRSGDPRVFDRLENGWDNIHQETMNECRRCRGAILEAANTIFLSAGGVDGARAPVREWCKQYTEHQAYEKDVQGEVAVKAALDNKDGDELNLSILERIKELINAGFKDIGILTRDNKEISETVDFLKANGVNADDESSGVKITNSKIVSLIISFLRFIDNPSSDSKELFFCSHSKLSGLFSKYSSTTDCAHDIREKIYADHNGLDKTLREVVGYFGSIDSKEEFFVEELWKFISANPLTNTTLSKLARRIEGYVIKGGKKGVGDSDAKVRVMTIHSSKGLEFDAVLLPFLSSKLADVSTLVKKDKFGGISQILLGVTKDLRKLSPEIDEMWEGAESDEIEGSLSLLYVALTRAKYSLTIWCRGSKEESLGEIVDKTLKSDLYGEKITQLMKKTSQVKKTAVSKDGLVENKIIPGKRKRALGVVSPSSIKKDLIERDIESSDYWEKVKYGSAYGDLVHGLLRKVEWSDDKQISIEDIEDVLGTVDPENEIAINKTTLLKRLNSKELLAKLSKSNYDKDAKVYTERSFAIPSLKDATLLSGTFDRIVFEPKKNKVHVIDFKTDAQTVSDVELSEKYKSQLESYRDAASRLFSVPIENVSVGLERV